MSALDCPVCLGVFENPMILICGHTICYDCILKLKHDKKDFSCPLCRVISNETQLRKNFSVIQVIEERKKVFAESKGLGGMENQSIYVLPETNSQIKPLNNNPLPRFPPNPDQVNPVNANLRPRIISNYGANPLQVNRATNFQPQRPVVQQSMLRQPPLVPINKPFPPVPPSNNVLIMPPNNAPPLPPPNEVPPPINRATKKPVTNEPYVSRSATISRSNTNLKPYDIDNFEERFNFNNNLPKPPKFTNIVI